MLAVAQTRVAGGELILGDITEPHLFEGEQFDVVTAFRFFANAEPSLRRAVIEKISRILKPNGMLIANNHKNCLSLQYRLSRVKSALSGRKPADTSCMSTPTLTSLCRQSGLTLEATYAWGMLPGNESRVFLPSAIHYAAEKTLSALGVGTNLALYHVCILRKTGCG